MANIGNLAFLITANSEQLTSGLSKASKEVKEFGDNTSRTLEKAFSMVSRGPTGLIGGLAGGLGLGVLTEGLKESNNKLLRVKEQAVEAGISIHDMMSFTGKMSEEESARAATGFARLQRNLADLKMGSVEAKVKFGTLGFDTVALQGKSAAEVIREVTTRIRESSNAAEKSALSRLFGERGGAQMLPGLERMDLTGAIGGRFGGQTERDVLMVEANKRITAQTTNMLMAPFRGLANIANIITMAVQGLKPLEETNRLIEEEKRKQTGREEDIFNKPETERREKSLQSLKAFGAEMAGQNAAARVSVSPLFPNLQKLVAMRAAAEELTQPRMKGGEMVFGLDADEVAAFNAQFDTAKQADIDHYAQGLERQTDALDMQAQTVGKSAAEVAVWTAKINAAKFGGDHFAKALENMATAARNADTSIAKYQARSPTKVFEEEMQRLQGLDIPDDVLAKMSKKAFDALDAARKAAGVVLPGEGPAPQALQFGTAAAAEQEIAFRRKAMLPEDPAARVPQILAAMKETEDQQLTVATLILEALQNRVGNVGENVHVGADFGL